MPSLSGRLFMAIALAADEGAWAYVQLRRRSQPDLNYLTRVIVNIC